MTVATLDALPALNSQALARANRRISMAGVFTWIAFALIIAGYLVFLHARFAPAISEPDDNGYFAQGTLLAQTGRTWFSPASDAQYIGMHWLLTPARYFISRYPPGLPLVIAIIDRLAGWKAATMVNPALSVIALLAFFLLAKRVVSGWWALVGVAVLEVNPTFIHHALSGDSHMGVTAPLLLGIYLLVRWSDEGKLWLAFAAGLCLGSIPTVRYPDGILAIGIALFLVYNVRRFPKIWKHYLAAIAGAAIPILPLLIRNQLLLGAFWRTGYSLTNEETGFSWAYFREHAIDYIHQINGNGIGLMFALGFIGMLCMIFKKSDPAERRNRPLGLMLLIMSTAMLLLYMAYYWAPQQNSAMTLRFLLPIYGMYTLAGLWLMREVAGRTSLKTQFILGLSLVGFQMLWGTSELLAQTDQLRYQHQSLELVTDALDKATAPGDVIVANSNIVQHLDFVRQWKIADGSILRGNQMGGPGGGGRGFGGDRDPDAPSPQQAAKLQQQRQKYPGTTTQREKKFIDDLVAWAGDDHKIYVVGTADEVQQWRGMNGAATKILAHVPFPKMPEDTTNDPMGRRRVGGFGGGVGGGMPGMARGLLGGGGPGGFGGPNARGGGGPMRGFTGESEIVIAELVINH